MWYVIVAIAAFALGMGFGPRLKLAFMHWRADPISAINADIDKLRAFKSRLLGDGRTPPPPPSPPVAGA